MLSYIRNNVEDATAPPAAKHDTPVRTAFVEQKLPVILAIGVFAISTAVNYLVMYMPTYVVKPLNLSPTIGYVAAFVAAIAAILPNPVAERHLTHPVCDPRHGLGLQLQHRRTAFGGMRAAIMTWLGSFALIGGLAPATT